MMCSEAVLWTQVPPLAGVGGEALGLHGPPQLFRLGEVIQATVSEQGDPHHAILQFKGQNLWVESRIPLPSNLK